MSAWESYRDRELTAEQAAELQRRLDAGDDEEFLMEQALTAWAANQMAGDMARAFVERVQAEAAQRVSTSRRVRSVRQSKRLRRARKRQTPVMPIFLALAALLIVAVGLAVWVNARSTVPTHDAPPVAADPDPAQPLIEVLLTSEQGQVRALPPNEPLRLAPGITNTLTVGSSVLAAGTDGVTTELFWQPSAEAIRWHVQRGQLSLNVKRAHTDPLWEVVLPDATVHVTGTEFIVQQTPQQWSVAVDEGVVQVAGDFTPQTLTAGWAVIGEADAVRRVPRPAPDALPVIIIIDEAHADDTTALIHALLAPTLKVEAILVSWEDDQQAVQAWCEQVVAACGATVPTITLGQAQALAAVDDGVAQSLSPAAQVLRQAARSASTQQPLTVLSLGSSISILGEAVRSAPEIAPHLRLIEVSPETIFRGKRRDPRAFRLIEQAGVQREVVSVDSPSALDVQPPAELRRVLNRESRKRVLFDAAVVILAEMFADGQEPTAVRMTGTELIQRVQKRWQQRSPKVIRQ